MPLPGSARDVGGDDIGGVPVQAAAGLGRTTAVHDWEVGGGGEPAPGAR
jgi:hypothetical protein